VLRPPVESGQYTSAQYAHLANQLKVTLSVGRTGQSWDNAVAESFFASLKAELIDRHTWPTRRAATAAIFDYIEGRYNTRRRHSPRLPQPRRIRGHHRRGTGSVNSHQPCPSKRVNITVVCVRFGRVAAASRRSRRWRWPVGRRTG